MRRLAIWTIAFAAVGLVTLALLDIFDIPRAALRKARPWLLEELGAAPVKPPPPPPRWERPVRSEAASPPPRFASHLQPAEAAEPSAVAPRAVELDGVSRFAVEGVVPHEFVLAVDIPTQGELWLSLNQDLSVIAADAILYEVSAGAGEPPLFRRLLPARHEGWENVRIDLGVLPAGSVSLRFRASMVGDRGTSAPATAYWGDLLLRSRSADPRPDITVVLIDTLRPDHLGAYGYERPTSPYIDGLAAEGVRFDRVISSAPWTDPSILSVMTGRYPRDLWKPAQHDEATSFRLPRSVTTLAEALANSGYHTIAASDHPGINTERFGRGFEVFSALHHGDGAYTRWRKTDEKHLLGRLERVFANRQAGPVFSYVHILYPHTPLEPPPGYLDAVGASLDGLDPASMDAERERYDAEIRVADDVVRQLRSLQSMAGWDEDDVVVIVSDHGEAFGEHGHVEHGNSLYNELLRVPLILHAPGRLPPGLQVDQTVRLVDVFPTLLELAKAPPVPGVRGQSLLPLIEGDGPARLAYSEFPHSRITEGYAVQSDLAKRVFGDPELGTTGWFDLEADASEQRPLGAPPEGSVDLADHGDEIRSATRIDVDATDGPSDDAIEMLRTLGYVD